MNDPLVFADLSEIIASANRHMRTHRACLFSQCPAAEVYNHMRFMIKGLMVSNTALSRAAASTLDSAAIIVEQGRQLDRLQEELSNRRYIPRVDVERLIEDNTFFRYDNARMADQLKAIAGVAVLGSHLGSSGLFDNIKDILDGNNTPKLIAE